MTASQHIIEKRQTYLTPALRPILPCVDVRAARLHVLVELIRLVELVRFGLLGIQPPLKQRGIVLGQVLIAFLDLVKLKL